MTPVILTAQRVIYAHTEVHLVTGNHALVSILPPWGASTYLVMDLGLCAVGVVLTYLALAVFGRLEGNFAEEL
jgi:hypothetical protein